MRQQKEKSRGRPVASAHPEARERLLDAAVALFASSGVVATPMGRIAQAVGVTPAMVYYYFKSREQLLDAVVDERVMRFVGHVLGASWEHATVPGGDAPHARGSLPPGDELFPGGTLGDRIHGVITRIVEGAGRMPWMPPLWIREVLSEGGALRERLLARVPFSALMAFAEEVRAGQERAEVNPHIDPRLTFLSVLGVTLLPFAMQSSWNDIPLLAGLSPGRLEEHAAALLLHGLCARPCRKEPSPSPAAALVQKKGRGV